MKKSVLVLFLFFLLIFNGINALGSEKVAVHAARMVDVVSGDVVNDVYVLIEGERIAGVGGREIVGGAKVIDLGDTTLLPGLIDMHTHLTLDLFGDYLVDFLRDTAADTALRAAKNAKATLHAGFTTVRDISSYYFTDVSLMRAIERGWVEGPRIFPCGHGISITGGSADLLGFAPGVKELGPEYGIADGVDQVIQSARYQIKNGAKFIKIYATGGVYSQSPVIQARQYSDAELKAAVDEARRHGLKIAAHAHGTEGIIAAVRAGVDSVEHGSMLDDEGIRLMKEKETYLVPTSYLFEAVDYEGLPKETVVRLEYVKKFARESHRKAVAAGVKIAFGTDACVFPHGDNAKEFAVLVELGMSSLEAIRAATLYAIDLLGVDDRGVIEKGRLADLIAVKGNPLEDIRTLENVLWIMKGGKIYKMQ